MKYFAVLTRATRNHACSSPFITLMACSNSIPFVEHCPYCLGERLASFGQVKALPDLFTSGQADGVGKLAQLHRHRWLRDMACLGGAGDTALLGQRQKEAQLAKSDVHRFLTTHMITNIDY